MERGSTQHSGRMDDVLAEEVEPLVRSGSEPRANEDRLHEPPADDEPSPDVRIAGEDVPMPGLLDLDEIEARSRLATSLRPSAFPATRAQLIAVATEEHATDEVLEALRTLPARRRFVHVQQVWEALGGERERRGAAVPRVEEPRVEEPRVEEPRVEEPRVEEPRVEEPRVEEPRVEEPRVDKRAPAPVAEVPRQSAPAFVSTGAAAGDAEPERHASLCEQAVRASLFVVTLPIRVTFSVARAVYERVVPSEPGH